MCRKLLYNIFKQIRTLPTTHYALFGRGRWHCDMLQHTILPPSSPTILQMLLSCIHSNHRCRIRSRPPIPPRVIASSARVLTGDYSGPYRPHTWKQMQIKCTHDLLDMQALVLCNMWLSTRLFSCSDHSRSRWHMHVTNHGCFFIKNPEYLKWSHMPVKKCQSVSFI